MRRKLHTTKHGKALTLPLLISEKHFKGYLSPSIIQPDLKKMKQYLSKDILYNCSPWCLSSLVYNSAGGWKIEEINYVL